jgi:non-ribosomal peptide synthetase component E (peptide arylation enzyme)
MPDPVMGEKQCAYVIPKPGQSLSFDEMSGFLRSQKIAPYKIPERLEIVTDFPMVAAGNKVDRNRLEADIAARLKREQQSKS